MPLTASSVEQLVCVDTCTDADTEECGQVLHVDYGVKCEGFGFAQGVAIATLLAFTLAIPGYLLLRARSENRVRVESLALDVTAMDKWFDELDADGSGSLEGDEIKQLVKKMHQGSTSKKLVKATIAELKSAAVATPRPGHGSEHNVVSKAQFQEWFVHKCSGCFETPFDVLFGTATAKAYWWWLQVLWLKTAINMLYAFGQASRVQWHLWMHLVLGASVCVMINVSPYNSLVDQQVELVALLCLAAESLTDGAFFAVDECVPAGSKSAAAVRQRWDLDVPNATRGRNVVVTSRAAPWLLLSTNNFDMRLFARNGTFGQSTTWWLPQFNATPPLTLVVHHRPSYLSAFNGATCSTMRHNARTMLVN